MTPSVVKVQTGHGSGSGVIVDVDSARNATIITNYHVIERSSSVTVIVYDTVRYAATVMGYDDVRDLAVLRICCDSFPVATLSTQPRIAPGTTVFASGYALGWGQAIATRGIVSAMWNNSDEGRWLVQTDAPINPGNSGGPLFNMAGEVVGINTFGIREFGGRSVEGFGFAVAARTVREMLPSLLAGAKTIPMIREFPAYRTVASRLNSVGDVWWRYAYSTGGDRHYYGSFNDGYFGMLPKSPLTEVFVYLDPDTPTVRHKRVIVHMLLAVGYDGETALDIVESHWPNQSSPWVSTSCMTEEQVVIATWWPSTDTGGDWQSSVYARGAPNWWQASSC